MWPARKARLIGPRCKASHPAHKVNKRVGEEPDKRQGNKRKQCGEPPMPLRITPEVRLRLPPAGRPHLIVWSVFAITNFFFRHTCVELYAGEPPPPRPELFCCPTALPPKPSQSRPLGRYVASRCDALAHRVWFRAQAAYTPPRPLENPKQPAALRAREL
jgi:hypothetical protein